MKELKMGFHPFHIVSYSPWPILSSMGAMAFVLSLLAFFNKSLSILVISFLLMTLCCAGWWRDVVRESTYQGCHTKEVLNGLRMGMVLFILSEVMFFFSFFFGWFFISLCPDPSVGMEFPPKGVQPLDYMSAPFLNTIILLSSGVSLTWCHHCLIKQAPVKSTFVESFYSLLITIILGMSFTYFQYSEYSEASFTIADSVYGSLFFVATGFHGIHVIVGMTFLSVCFYRLKEKHLSNSHHFGFEASAWYWHFVDVVWMFLFLSIYWWGS